MMNEFDSVDYSTPIYTDTLEIMCGYNYTERIQNLDLLDAYLSFPRSYYVSVTVSFFFFTLCWSFCCSLAVKIRKRLKRQLARARKPPYWVMICVFLDQDQYPKVSRKAFTIMSLGATLFFFVSVDCFILNTMSTDLVVIEEPMTIQSYQDIIDRKDVKVVFLPGMNEEVFFKHAQSGTYEAAIWKNRYTVSAISYGMDFLKIIEPALDQKLVMIVRHWIADVISHLLMGLVRKNTSHKNQRVLITKDETQKFIENGMMISKYSHPILKKFVHKQ